MILRKIISIYKSQVLIDESSLEKYQHSLKKRTLLYFLFTIIIGCFILGLINLIYFKPSYIAVSSLWGSAFLALIALLFNAQGRLNISAVLALIAILSAIIINMLTANGIHDPGIMAIPIFILVSSILFRKRIVLLFALISLLSVILVTALELNGYIKTPFTAVAFDDTIIFVILIIVFAYIMWVVLLNREGMINTIAKKVEQLEVIMEELVAQNEELEAQNEELIVTHNEYIDSEKKLRKSLLEKEVLLKEVHHRVKNNMQIICSLISLQCEEIDNMESYQILNNFKRRIRSMSLVHEKLYESDNLAVIDLNLYLTELINEYQNGENLAKKITIDLKIKDILLTIEHAIPLGLIINEILINAFKHAFNEKKSGKISIEGKKDKKNFLIIIKDNGKGISKDFNINNTETLGLKLVNILIHQLDGKVKIKSEKGTQFILTFPCC